jgi:hypothetical protein
MMRGCLDLNTFILMGLTLIDHRSLRSSAFVPTVNHYVAHDLFQQFHERGTYPRIEHLSKASSLMSQQPLLRGQSTNYRVEKSSHSQLFMSNGFFLDRITRVMKSNVNKWVSNIENPEKVINQAVVDMQVCDSFFFHISHHGAKKPQAHMHSFLILLQPRLILFRFDRHMLRRLPVNVKFNVN